MKDLALSRFDISINKAYADAIADQYDYPVGDCETLHKVVKKHESSNGSTIAYWILQEGVPVGFLDFERYSELNVNGDKAFDIGLFIANDYRSQGIADVVLHTAVEFLRKIHYPFIATANVDNVRSVAFVTRALAMKGMLMHEPNRGRDALVWDFEIHIVKRMPTLFTNFDMLRVLIQDVELFHKAYQLL